MQSLIRGPPGLRLGSLSALKCLQDRLKSAQDTPKSAQEVSKSAPTVSKSHQDNPKSAPEAPKSAQDASKRAPEPSKTQLAAQTAVQPVAKKRLQTCAPPTMLPTTEVCGGTREASYNNYRNDKIDWK